MSRLYYIDPAKNYLQELADFLIENHAGEIAKIQIFLPTRRACRELLHILSRREETFRSMPQSQALGGISAKIEASHNDIWKILPIGEYDEEGEDGDSFAGLTLIPKLEQQRVITNIIHSYKPLGFTIYQSASLASSLSFLFSQIDSEQIDIKKLSEISVDDSAEHWVKILDFLTFSYNAFKGYLQETKQIDYPNLRNLKIKNHIEELNPQHPIIIAGSSGSVKAVRDLIKAISRYDNCYAILPAINPAHDTQEAEISPFHHIKKLMEFCSVKECRSLREVIDDEAISKSTLSHKISASPEAPGNDVLYFETENPLAEAKLIASLINDLTTKNSYAKIAVVTHNQGLISNIELYLKKYNLQIDSGFGYEIRTTDFSTFIILLARMVLSGFVVIDILALLKHKFLICGHVFAIEKELFRGTEIIEGYSDLKSKKLKFEESQIWFDDFLKKLEPLAKLASGNDVDFAAFTEKLLEISSSLRGGIGCKPTDAAISDFLEEYQKTSCPRPGLAAHSLAMTPVAPSNEDDAIKFFQEFAAAHKSFIHSKESYIFLLEKYISTARFYPKFGWNSNIFALNPIEMRMLTFDHIIVADMNESSWPKNVPADPWMNIKMREELGLPLMQDNISKSFHDFYVLTHAKNFIITRAVKNNGAETSISRFVKSLLPSLREGIVARSVIARSIYKVEDVAISEFLEERHKNVTPSTGDCHTEHSSYPDNIGIHVPKHLKPKKLAATHIELLIRNPYAFYARKILKLYPLDEIMKQPDFADFGNFIHKVFEDYCSDIIARNNSDMAISKDENHSHSEITQDSGDCRVEHSSSRNDILTIGKQILAEYHYSNFTKNLWWPKFVNIAEAFLKFAKEKDLEQIFTEIEGRWNIHFDEDIITLTAKADRIEITKDHKVNIIDYKTGGVPSKKDVSLGLSPQLLIEQMIVETGGFKEFAYREIGDLVYVKISASKPNIKEICIETSAEIIKEATLGLKKLLRFYLSDDFAFHSMPNKKYAPRYNDYEHLAR
jgi:ATP-dependent helicase/nuclease subunit B